VGRVNNVGSVAEYREISRCEVCGNQRLIPVLDLGFHPMCDDLVPIGDTRICINYPISVLFCEACRTGHQRFQLPKRQLFPESYHYRSRFTADVLSGMKNLVASCEQFFGSLAGKKVVDVGCNDGSLLDFFKEKRAITIGVEPTAAANDCENKGHVTIKSFLSEDVANAIVAQHGQPDFITFTNVFAHIENLEDVLFALKILIGNNTTLVIENHYLGSILRTNQFDTFYHEHPRTYSYTSFVFIARSLELNLLHVEFPSRYGGNIRIFAGKTPSEPGPGLAELAMAEANFGTAFAALERKMVQWREKKGDLLRDMTRRNGKLRAKAFPGRAAILVKLLGLNEESITAVHEKPGSMKIGHYLPGTRIPIQSDSELFSSPRTLNPLLNLAWHIPKEIRSYLNDHGYDGSVIDIVSDDDFDLHRARVV
jgi:hypothetical protein